VYGIPGHRFSFLDSASQKQKPAISQDAGFRRIRQVFGVALAQLARLKLQAILYKPSPDTGDVTKDAYPSRTETPGPCHMACDMPLMVDPYRTRKNSGVIKIAQRTSSIS
jgi:hypothetical protein